MPTSPPDRPASTAALVRLGTTARLEPELVWELAAHGIAARTIPEDADPPAQIDVVLVLELPSALLGRCRGRWPMIVAVDDPRATDVSRLLRAGASDVIRRPIQIDELVDRIHRLSPSATDETDDERG